MVPHQSKVSGTGTARRPGGGNDGHASPSVTASVSILTFPSPLEDIATALPPSGAARTALGGEAVDKDPRQRVLPRSTLIFVAWVHTTAPTKYSTTAPPPRPPPQLLRRQAGCHGICMRKRGCLCVRTHSRRLSMKLMYRSQGRSRPAVGAFLDVVLGDTDPPFPSASCCWVGDKASVG